MTIPEKHLSIGLKKKKKKSYKTPPTSDNKVE